MTAASILFAAIKRHHRPAGERRRRSIVGLDIHEHGMKGYADFVFAEVETDEEFTLQR